MDIAQIEMVLTNKLKEMLEINREIDPKEDLRMAGLNSLKTIELIVAIESFFDLEVPDEEILLDSLASVNQIVTYVSNKLNV